MWHDGQLLEGDLRKKLLAIGLRKRLEQYFQQRRARVILRNMKARAKEWIRNRRSHLGAAAAIQAEAEVAEWVMTVVGIHTIPITLTQ